MPSSPTDSSDGSPTKGRARAVGRGLGVGARATGRAGAYAVASARRAARAGGAGASGLSRLIEMHAFNTAGDAAVAMDMDLVRLLHFADQRSQPGFERFGGGGVVPIPHNFKNISGRN